MHGSRVTPIDRRTYEAAQPMPSKAAPAQPPAENEARKDGGKPEDGFPATAADGRVLNLDFEKGDLSDWTAEGNAFEGQPIEGDTVHSRRPDSVSGHQGKYWIGTYERDFDGPQGTLTSVPFQVTHPYASFFVGGGAAGAGRGDRSRRHRRGRLSSQRPQPGGNAAGGRRSD